MKLVETTIRTENHHLPDRPIYLVGESVGACLALAVAARIPHIDLVLLLSNSGEHHLVTALHFVSQFVEFNN